MPRRKERPKFIHQASSIEYLHCLQNMSEWSELLLSQSNNKKYNDFLKWILEQDYFKSNNDINITQISKLSGYPSVKVSRWLQEIYNEILDLNENNPDLFYSEKGIRTELYIRYFDNNCSFFLTLPALPRIYETLEFFFIKAKIGWNTFWVKDVRYYVDENKSAVCIFLEGGILNKYREFAVEKALFEGKLSYMDLYEKVDMQIDDLLLGRKRDL